MEGIEMMSQFNLGGRSVWESPYQVVDTSKIFLILIRA